MGATQLSLDQRKGRKQERNTSPRCLRIHGKGTNHEGERRVSEDGVFGTRGLRGAWQVGEKLASGILGELRGLTTDPFRVFGAKLRGSCRDSVDVVEDVY